MTTKKLGREVWKRHVLEWRRTNERAAVYAKRAGISARSLAWWRWRLERDGEVPTDTAPAVPFIDMTTVDERGTVVAPIEVALANGRVVRVPSSFDESALRRVLAVADEVKS